MFEVIILILCMVALVIGIYAGDDDDEEEDSFL